MVSRYASTPADKTHKGWFSNVIAGITSVAAGVVLVAASYLPGQLRETYAAPSLQLGIEAPDSLWGVARERVEPDRIFDATEALALENGYCAPSVWAEQYPDRVDSGLERFLEEAPCEDGSPNPHYIEKGETITTTSIDGLEERIIPEQGPNTAVLAGGLAAIVLGGIALAYPGKRDDHSPVIGEHIEYDPDLRPAQSSTLFYGHAYLMSKDYAAIRDRKTPLVGAAKRAVERKAARLNRLAAALENDYIPGMDAESMLKDAVEDRVSDRTLRSYIDDLASLGHTQAQIYQVQRKNTKRKAAGSTKRKTSPNGSRSKS